VASLLNNVANVNHLRGRNTEAVQGFRAALDIWSRTLGSDHPMVATAHLNLAACLDDTQREEATAHLFAARDIYVRKLGPDHPDVAIVESDLGSHFATANDPKEALAHFQRALPVLEKAHDPAASNAMMGIGLVHFYGHRQTEAALYFHRAVKYREEIYGDTHPLFAESLFMYGQALTWGGKPAEALPVLERAYAILEQGSPPLYLRAQAPMYLAQALGESGRDPKRARELAARALEYSKDPGAHAAVVRGYAEAFLADGTVRKRFPS
jgi:tetratricopeptide (TPR) repeat protein